MTFRRFSLQPFPQNVRAYELKIVGKVWRSSKRLSIHYKLFGQLKAVAFSQAADMPARKYGLWKDTCFEFFLAVKDSSRYWEFNLSPAGHWNVFRFAAYRKGMKEETAMGMLPFRVRRQPGALSLCLEIELDEILHKDQALDVGISTVIKHCEGRMSYWSLSHPGPQADFHNRDGFLIHL